MALYVNGNNNAIYFDSFELEHIPREIKKLIGNRNIITNIYRIMCEYFCIGIIDFMLKGKSLLDYINLFYPDEFEKNDKIMQKYFQ